MDGEIKPVASKADEGKLQVKYTIPLTPETKYSVLETDYDSYAVLWSCQNLGLAHTQNAWIMSRKRIPPGEVLQKVMSRTSKSDTIYNFLTQYKLMQIAFIVNDKLNLSVVTYKTNASI